MGKIRGNRKTVLMLLLTGLLLLPACGTVEKPQAAPADNGDKGGIVLPTEPEPIPEPKPRAATAPFTGLELIATGADADQVAGSLDNLAKQRPIAVMVNNYKAARPQSGLTHADIVWEVLAEGGITRLVAIFQSDNTTETIGPIRSIRPYLIEMGEMYNAVLVHAGASNDGYAILQQQRKQHLDEISNAGPFFWRESFRKAPHNLYSNLEKMREGAKQKKYPEDVAIPVMSFLAPQDRQAVAVQTGETPRSGEASQSGGATLGSGESQSGRATPNGGVTQNSGTTQSGGMTEGGSTSNGGASQSSGGTQSSGASDSGTAAQRGGATQNGNMTQSGGSTSNGGALQNSEVAERIEIYFSLKNYRVSYEYDSEKQLYYRFVDKEPHIDLNNEEQLSASNLVVLGTKHRTLDDVGRLSVDLSSGGPAMLFQQGRMVECEWMRVNGDIIRIVKDGQELPFVPGKTYYHIVPLTPSFEDHITYG